MYLGDFFAMGRDADGAYWSKDFAFSRRWRSTGGRIFADATIKLGHHGDFAYEGDPLTMFKVRPATAA